MDTFSFRRLVGRNAGAERLVLGALPQAIAAVDVNERPAFINTAAATLLGDTAETAAGRSLHQALETITPEGSRACALCIANRDNERLEGDAVVIAGDTRTPVRFTAAPIMDRVERVGTVLTLEAPAAPGALEQELRERVAREMQAMMADLAHELNNPLTVILAGAGMLRENTTDDGTRRRADLLAEAAERCVGIVRAFRSSIVAARPDETVVSAPASPAAPPARAQILVVDDDPLVASAMAAALVAEGHEVDIADDGLSALTRISTRRYDVVLTDLRMPRLDGPGLYAELGRIRPEMASRVVFVTGDTLSPSTRRFLDSVSAPFVRKPFEPRQLRTAVRRLLAGEDRDIA